MLHFLKMVSVARQQPVLKYVIWDQTENIISYWIHKYYCHVEHILLQFLVHWYFCAHYLQMHIHHPANHITFYIFIRILFKCIFISLLSYSIFFDFFLTHLGLLGFFIAGLSSGLYQTYFLSDGVITTPFYYPVLLDSVYLSSTSGWVWDSSSI